MSVSRWPEAVFASRRRRLAVALPFNTLASHALLAVMVARLAARVALSAIPRAGPRSS